MEGFLIPAGDVLVASAANAQIIGRPLHKILMGRLLFHGRRVSLMTGGAALLEMGVLADQLPVD
jgi:hypothetical protein